jgi:hypothetical protein
MSVCQHGLLKGIRQKLEEEIPQTNKEKGNYCRFHGEERTVNVNEKDGRFLEIIRK